MYRGRPGSRIEGQVISTIRLFLEDQVWAVFRTCYDGMGLLPSDFDSVGDMDSVSKECFGRVREYLVLVGYCLFSDTVSLELGRAGVVLERSR